MLYFKFSNWFLCIVDLSLTSTPEGAFEGEDVTHVEGDVNPVRDLEIISDELRQKVGSSFNFVKCSF